MNVKAADLPGIGRKYSLHTAVGDTLVIIVHLDGRRDLFHMKADDPDEMQSVVTLDDKEAGTAAAIIAGLID
ncbi:hypothetical protein [Paenibacillus sp. UMB4589-SE434]|uniref:hypothetical protein n=1 Tax=Paenibacillus sp. UMB4589-SE434 TaxID=3046314 RepID=UPI00255078ED|nr:hypothetical protein [Paenibacillus sp. UMB4589-SE434]MDK8181075.1 hypothetical protein [Paenibacillus sp. UMB4589-SE434]